MQKDLHLGIKTPCHETWGQMIPTSNGRYCSSCQKTVVDFSNMDDQEIIQWFAGHQGPVCGRFDPKQLNRNINPVRKKKNIGFRYWQYLLAGLLFASEATAQTSASQKHDTIQIPGGPQVPQPVSDSSIHPESQGPPDRFHGRIVDENGVPVAFATVVYKPKKGVLSDGNGNFSIPMAYLSMHDILTISGVGRETIKVPVAEWMKTGQNSLAVITLKQASMLLGDVVITVRRRPTPIIIADTMAILKDTLSSVGLVKKALNVYPNPAVRGAAVNLAVRLDQAGIYTLRLYSIAGLLVKSQEVDGNAKATNVTMTIPASLAPGTYVVKLSNPASSKCYTQQIIVK